MSEWISVKDRLPNESPVLIAFLEPHFGVLSHEFGVGYYDDPNDYEDEVGEGWLFWLNDVKVLGGGVTHWQPLPDPPKE